MRIGNSPHTGIRDATVEMLASSRDVGATGGAGSAGWGDGESDTGDPAAAGSRADDASRPVGFKVATGFAPAELIVRPSVIGHFSWSVTS
jgi:hypothetical protein